jgi:hypothetical protein
VARHEHGAALRRLLAHEPAHPGDPGRIEPVGGLVQDQHPGIAEQRRRDRQPLAHAHRVALHAAAALVGEADGREHLVDPPGGVPAGGGQHAQVIARRAAGVERRVLEHRAHLRARPVELLVAAAAEGGGAGRRVDQAEQGPQSGALARAVGAQEAGHAPSLHVEAQVPDGLHRAEALREPADLDGRHAGIIAEASGVHRLTGA